MSTTQAKPTVYMVIRPVSKPPEIHIYRDKKRRKNHRPYGGKR